MGAASAARCAVARSAAPARVVTARHTVSLDDLVPADDFYRHLDRVRDLAFVRDLVRDTYAPAGRPRIDPVVFQEIGDAHGGRAIPRVRGRRPRRRASAAALGRRRSVVIDGAVHPPWHLLPPASVPRARTERPRVPTGCPMPSDASGFHSNHHMPLPCLSRPPPTYPVPGTTRSAVSRQRPRRPPRPGRRTRRRPGRHARVGRTSLGGGRAPQPPCSCRGRVRFRRG